MVSNSKKSPHFLFLDSGLEFRELITMWIKNFHKNEGSKNLSHSQTGFFYASTL